MKQSLTGLILEKLNEVGELTLEAIFPKNRTEGKVWRKILNLPTTHTFSPQTFSVILSRLKKEGLVEKTGSHRSSLWFLTKKGKDKLKNRNSHILPEPDGLPRLVVYDIPETDKRKREWLRGELVASDYEQLQRSVWLGYRPLSQRFINYLDEFRLKGKVHILSIDKKGTLDL